MVYSSRNLIAKTFFIILVACFLVGCKVTIVSPLSGSVFEPNQAVYFKAEFSGTGNIAWKSEYTQPDGSRHTLDSNYFTQNAKSLGQKGFPWEFEIKTLPKGNHKITAYKGNDNATTTIKINSFCEKTTTNCAVSGECIEGYCDLTEDKCKTRNKTNGTVCSDGNPATQNDRCENGTCIGENVAECSPNDGICCVDGKISNEGANCLNDGNDCTNDVCKQGACVQENVLAGIACGDRETRLCSAPDECDGNGVCDPRHFDNSIICKHSAGLCDVVEYCDGNGSCQEDGFKPLGEVCRTAGSECDEEESCTGESPLCPENVFKDAGVECGNKEDSICDGADTCDGSGECLNNIRPQGTVCRTNGTNECDVAEVCDGLGHCPPDTYALDGTECDNGTNQCLSGSCVDCLDISGCGDLQDDGLECSEPACDQTTNLCYHKLDAHENEECTDDGFTCTGNICSAGGQCESTVKQGSCLISEQCYDDNSVNLSNHCEICNSGSSQDSWSMAQDGSVCNEANQCLSGQCVDCIDDDGCSDLADDGLECSKPACNFTTNECYHDLSASTGKPCNDDGKFCTINLCESDGTCGDSNLQEGTCHINDVCYGPNERNPDPTKQCEACISDLSTTDWSTATNDTSCNDSDPCTTADHCQDGVCMGGGPTCTGQNETCDNGTCNCSDGYFRENGVCVEDPCYGVTCSSNQICQGGNCICDSSQGWYSGANPGTCECNALRYCSDRRYNCGEVNLPCDSGNPVSCGTCDSVSECGTDNRCRVVVQPTEPVIQPKKVALPYNIHNTAKQIYSGNDKVQHGVDEDKIDTISSSIIKGKIEQSCVTGKCPLAGVKVSILDHEEYGVSLSRDCGEFEIVVNGGSNLIVDFAHKDYYSTQRRIKIKPGSFKRLENVTLVKIVEESTPVNPSTAINTEVVKSELIADSRGTRQSTLLINPDTDVILTYEDGTKKPILGEMNIKISEFTTEDNGEDSMPGNLPTATQYTYCAEFDIEEANNPGVVNTEFSKPVYVYVDNFLDFELGASVPSGYYDKKSGKWNSAENGIVIGVKGIESDKAIISLAKNSTGDMLDTPQEYLDKFGFTDKELEKIADLYGGQIGKTLWRMPLKHFSTYDFNPTVGLGDYIPPEESIGGGGSGSDPENQTGGGTAGGSSGGGSSGGNGSGIGSGGTAEGGNSDTPVEDPCLKKGSIIECENQVLGETVPITGTDMSLNYRSDRVIGRNASRTLKIPLVGTNELPEALTGISAKVTIGGDGVFYEKHGRLEPKSSTTFVWNGKDGYGNQMQSEQTANVEICYHYPRMWATNQTCIATQNGQIDCDENAVDRFGAPQYDDGFILVNSDEETKLCNQYEYKIGQMDLTKMKLGGWSIDNHHIYDPYSRILYKGDGTKRYADTENNKIVYTHAGVGTKYKNDKKGVVAIRDSMGNLVIHGRNSYMEILGDIYSIVEDNLGNIYFVVKAPKYYNDRGELIESASFDTLFKSSRKGELTKITLYNDNGIEVGVPKGEGSDPWQATNKMYMYNNKIYIATNSDYPDSMGGPTYHNALIYEIELNDGDTAKSSIYAGDANSRIYSSLVYKPAKYNRSKSDGIYEIEDIAIDSEGNVYYSDNNYVKEDNHSATALYKIESSGMINLYHVFDYKSMDRFDFDGQNNIYYHERNWPNYEFKKLGIDGKTALLASVPMDPYAKILDFIVDDIGIIYYSLQRNVGNKTFYDVHKILANGTDLILAGNPESSGQEYDISKDDGTSPIGKDLGKIVGLMLSKSEELFFVSGNNKMLQSINPSLPGNERNISTSSATVSASNPNRNSINSENNDFIVIPSSDGREIYFFDKNGLHIETRDAITDAVIYMFEYDTHERLTSITDAYWQRLEIRRNSETGYAEELISPDGHVTRLTITDGYLTKVADPQNIEYGFRYKTGTAEGLMSLKIDPNGNYHYFVYDDLGRLVKDQAPDGYQILLSKERIDNNKFKVEVRTAENRVSRFQYEFNVKGTQEKGYIAALAERIFTSPDGSSVTSKYHLDYTSTEKSDESIIISKRKPHPRWGMLVPFISEATTIIPLFGTQDTKLTSTYQKDISIDFEDPINKTNPQTMTKRMIFHGKEYTEVTDYNNKTITQTSPEGVTTSFELNEEGDITKILIGGIEPVSVEYNLRGKISRVTQGTRSFSMTYYQAQDHQRGFLKSVTNNLGQKTEYFYDPSGRVSSQILADESEILNSYDDNGNIIRLTPDNDVTHKMRYTSGNMLAEYSISPSDDNYIQYVYNLDREITRIIRSSDSRVDYIYDVDGGENSTSTGQLLEILDLKVGEASFQYQTDKGRYLEKMINPDHGSTFNSQVEYFYSGDVVSMEKWTGDIPVTISYLYKDGIEPQTLKVNDLEVGYIFDDDKRIYTAGKLKVIRIAEQDLVSRIEVSHNSVVTHSQFSYNDYGEVMEIDTYHDNDAMMNIDYGRDGIGRIDYKKEVLDGITLENNFEFNEIGQLVRTLDNESNILREYEYDAHGNRLSFTDNTGDYPVILEGAYDYQDRLLKYGDTCYEYGNDMFLKYKRTGCDAVCSNCESVTEYDFDSRGNLIEVVLPGGYTVEYIIDGKNRRIGKKIDGSWSNKWVYSGNSLNPIADLEVDGTSNKVNRLYVYATKRNIPDYMIDYEYSPARTFSLITDHLGSLRMVIDAETGEIKQKITYDEFGDIIENYVETGFSEVPFGFAGGLYDHVTGLVKFGARDYDPKVGRWITKDPILFNGGQTNLYVYVKNDPVNFVDPEGKHPAIVLPFTGPTAATQFGFVVKSLLDIISAVGLAKSADCLKSCFSADGEDLMKECDPELKGDTRPFWERIQDSGHCMKRCASSVFEDMAITIDEKIFGNSNDELVP